MTIPAFSPLSPSEVRTLCRQDKWKHPSTSGFAEGHVQANLLILPKRYADDFLSFCKRNPVPCPLLGYTSPGDPTLSSKLALGCDISTDVPSYCIYEKGKLVETVSSLKPYWQADSVGFVIGCSYSFEGALLQAGLIPRHIELGRKVPMYKTNVPLAAGGVFSGPMVVSMRPYPKAAIPDIVRITRPYVRAHGEPFAIGEEGAKALGITDLTGTKPDFGDPTEIREGEVPVYWGCGVTPQNVVMSLGDKIEGIVMGHEPGRMLVLDMVNDDVCETVKVDA